MCRTQGVGQFVFHLRDIKHSFDFVQLRQHQIFIFDEEFAVALVLEEFLEVLLSQHICKGQERLHVAHIDLDCLDNVEDDVCIADSECDLTEVLISLCAQCGLEVFVRGDDQGEPEAPFSPTCGGQGAAVDFAKNFLDCVRIVFFERDYALLGLLSDSLSIFTHGYRGEIDKSLP